MDGTVTDSLSKIPGEIPIKDAPKAQTNSTSSAKEIQIPWSSTATNTYTGLEVERIGSVQQLDAQDPKQQMQELTAMLNNFTSPGCQKAEDVVIYTNNCNNFLQNYTQQLEGLKSSLGDDKYNEYKSKLKEIKPKIASALQAKIEELMEDAPDKLSNLKKTINDAGNDENGIFTLLKEKINEKYPDGVIDELKEKRKLADKYDELRGKPTWEKPTSIKNKSLDELKKLVEDEKKKSANNISNFNNTAQQQTTWNSIVDNNCHNNLFGSMNEGMIA